MKDGYEFLPTSSRETLLETLRKLSADAKNKAKDASYAWVTMDDTKDLHSAIRYEAQREILDRLEWALSGTAEAECGDGHISIY
jgi:hypothetical protein